MSADEDDFDELMAALDDDEPELDEEDDLSLLDEFEEEPEPLPESEPEAAPEPTVLGRDRATGKASVLISVAATKDSEAIRRPLMSGHCAFPGVVPAESHARCKGYTRANPDKIFQPCPCLCHFPEERYECGNCGGTILAAPHYPPDEDGDKHYVHLDTKRMRVTDGECSR